MRPLHVALAGLAAFWLQVTLAPHLSLFGVRPDLLLLTVILLGIRWVHPGLYVYAALAGLAQDSFSHGMLGVYGIGYLIVAALANVTGTMIYEQHVLFIVGAVFALTLAEGVAVLAVLETVGSEIAWVSWFFGAALPQAFYHAALTPAVLWIVHRVERLTRHLPLSR